jgi:hypothetical protein
VSSGYINSGTVRVLCVEWLYKYWDSESVMCGVVI